MRRIPFDRDAVPMSPREARRHVAGAGFAAIELRSLFYFPRALAALRFLGARARAAAARRADPGARHQAGALKLVLNACTRRRSPTRARSFRSSSWR